MKNSIALLSLVFWLNTSFAQVPVGKWQDHFSFNTSLFATSSSDKIYVAGANGVFWFNPSDKSVGKITKVHGLSDVGISAIEFSPYQELLMVGYENGKIDLVFKDQIISMAYIYQNPMQGTKQINHFFFDSKDKVYVSTGFGIVVINIEKREISDTYFIGQGGSNRWVNGIVNYNDRLYAATSNGILSADYNDPLLIHFESWSLELGLPNQGAEFSSLALFDGKLIAVQRTEDQVNDVIWIYDDFSWSQLDAQFNNITSLHVSHDKLIITDEEELGIMSSIPGVIDIINHYEGFTSFSPNQGIFDFNGNLVVADRSLGMMHRANSEWARVLPNGPRTNWSYFVLPTPDDLLVAAGARDDAWGNRYFPFMFHTYSKNRWRSTSNYNFFDALRIAKSPFHPNEYYIGSWGHGVVVYREGEQTQWYNPDNSTLQTVIPGPYCRIGGLTFDSKGNLWVSNSGVSNAISMLATDGEWHGFPYQNVINSSRQSDIIATPWDHLWVIIPSGGGFFVLDPGSNPNSMNSHETRVFRPFSPEGELLPSDIYSLAFDRNGYLWVGTNEGVLVSYNPQRVFEPSAFSIQRLRIPSEDPEVAAYLLGSEVVTTIAVDGGNRKWFGTQRSGVFLQSTDGSQQLLHFNKDNSPLPSNSILHIGISPSTGNVFFATDKGLVSYRGDATEPSRLFGEVYAFPNPVRPDYDGLITITGLVDDTNVKITDIAGNLVYETQSKGGQATWDGKNLHGRRVSTGVYLYFCSDRMGEQSAVGKILFVK